LGEPVQKILRSQRIAKGKLTSILDGISHPLSEALSEECRKMLLAAIPMAICVPSDQRHPIQEEAVSMVGTLFDGIAAKVQEVMASETAAFTEVEQKLAGLTDTATKAAATQTEKEAEVAAAKTAVTEATEALSAAGVTLTEKKSEQTVGDREKNAKTKEKAQVESVISVDLAAVTSGGPDGAPAAKEHVDALLSLAGKLSFETSLLEAMPSSLTKKPDLRGPFDGMVLQQLGERFKQRVEELATGLAGLEGTSKTLADAVTSAEDALQKANKVQDDAAAALAAAEARLAEAKVAKETADAAVAEYTPEMEKATGVMEEKKSEAESFTATKTTFEELKARLSKAAQAEAEPAEPAPEAEAGA
jgi:hypothetical protein